MNSDESVIVDILHRTAAESGFSGVTRVDVEGRLVAERAYGLADRAHRVPVTAEHRFGVASVSKGFTAAAVGSLVDDGRLSFEDVVRPILRADLPLIDDRVNVGHLLAHTSGIGDYLDESEGEADDYVLDVPVHRLDRTEAFVPVMDGRAQVGVPGAGFAYNNAGFVVLALVVERVSGVAFHEFVAERVFRPAGMTSSGYPRMDELPAEIARGYLDDDGLRSNVLHLPVRGSGDGGAMTTVADLAKFWSALRSERIVSATTLATLTDPISMVDDEGMRYGRGFWRGRESDLIILEGADAGVSARTWIDPTTGISASVIANTTNGAWPVLRALDWS